MSNEKKANIKRILEEYDYIKTKIAYELTQTTDYKDRDIYSLLLNILYELNALGSDFKELGKLRHILAPENTQNEIEKE